MTKKKKQDIGEAIRRFREGPRMGPPKPKPPSAPPREPVGEFDSPGFQSAQQRIDSARKTKERKRKGTGQVR